VYHIDGGAVAALTHYYAQTIKPKSDILDICSSWVRFSILYSKLCLGVSENVLLVFR